MSSGRWRVRGLWPLGLYVALSVLLFGLPVIGHLDSRIVAADQFDSGAVMWFLAWWPHAILHGSNPFIEHAMLLPEGFNLTWGTSLPGPALLLSPITLAFGPAVTWNVLQLGSPALTAWTTFLLCRHITGRVTPSLVGGYLFGFSPYMLVNLTGAPSLAMLALVPVFVLLVLRRLQGSMRRRWFVVTMSVVLAAQYLVSGEVLATAALFGGLALVVALVLMAPLRAALLDTIGLLALAGVGAAILISPFLYYFFFGPHYPPGATYFVADLASFVLPPPLLALGRGQPPFAGAGTESYIGVALVIIVIWFTWRGRRRPGTWVMVTPLLAAAACSLGSYLIVRGHLTSIAGPWLLLSKWPVLRFTNAVRLVVFIDLPAAVIVAMFLGGSGQDESGLDRSPQREPPQRASSLSRSRESRRLWRWGLALLGVAMIFPDVGNRAWDTPIHDPAFFSDGAYRSYLTPADRVLTVPAWGPNQRWQADTRFRFRLADGYAGNPFPASYTRFATYRTLLTGRLTPDYAAQLRRFVHAKEVTAIVVDETIPGPWAKLFGTLGVRPTSTGGVRLYRLGRP